MKRRIAKKIAKNLLKWASEFAEGDITREDVLKFGEFLAKIIEYLPGPTRREVVKQIGDFVFSRVEPLLKSEAQVAQQGTSPQR